MVSTPEFDTRYVTVLECPLNEHTPRMVHWVHNNTESRLVDVKFVDNRVYIGFSNSADALIFKIKFL